MAAFKALLMKMYAALSVTRVLIVLTCDHHYVRMIRIMPVTSLGTKLQFVKLELEPTEIPELLKSHRKNWEPSARLEEEAQSLIAEDFPHLRSAEFSEQVIRWGRGQRFVGRFRQRNNDGDIASSLKRAVLMANSGEITLAVSELQKLKYLGQSFASKLVRFMCPIDAVILDEVIRNRLGYQETAAGYEEFLADCRAVLEVAQQKYPELRICDVEAAIFAKIQGY